MSFFVGPQISIAMQLPKMEVKTFLHHTICSVQFGQVMCVCSVILLTVIYYSCFNDTIGLPCINKAPFWNVNIVMC